MHATLFLLIASVFAAPPAVHDFHVTYGRLAVEGEYVVGRIRFFRDDLERALADHGGRPGLRMEANAHVDSVFLDYVAERFRIEAGGQVLPARLLSSGEDEIDHEPAWWYLVRFDAEAPIERLTLSNTLLFELHDDQKNMVKVVHFPDATEWAFTFSSELRSVNVEF